MGPDILDLPVLHCDGAERVAEGLRLDRPWGRIILGIQPAIEPGFWRLRRAHDAAGPIEIHLWSVDHSQAFTLTLEEGRSRLLRLTGGEYRMALRADGDHTLIRPQITLLRAGAPIPVLAERAWRALLSGALVRRLAGPGPQRPKPVTARLSRDQVLRRRSAPITNDGAGEAGPAAGPPLLRVVLAPGDVLAPHALETAAQAFRRDTRKVALYADDVRAGIHSPKPRWDPEHAIAKAYTRTPVFIRLDRAPDAPPETAAYECHDWLRALSDRQGQEAVGLLPTPLVWNDAMTEDRKPAASPERPGAGPRVSAVIPTRDRPDLLDGCLGSLLAGTDYPDLEVIVVDNGSVSDAALTSLDRWRADPRVQVLRVDEPFNFSRLCNLGVAKSTGALTLLLNDDVQALEPSWLRRMAAEAVRPQIGAVGPLLLYADHSIQHAGVAVGLFGTAGHPWRGYSLTQAPPEALLRGSRSALTAACLLVRREVYDAVGGMNEADYPVTLNDVDFCLRVQAAGLRNLYLPDARLLHLESQTRKPDHHPDNVARRRREEIAFERDWGPGGPDDVFFSPAFSRAGESLAAILS